MTVKGVFACLFVFCVKQRDGLREIEESKRRCKKCLAIISFFMRGRAPVVRVYLEAAEDEIKACYTVIKI